MYFLDIAGTLVFAISGALAANRNDLDFLGFMVLAVATGVGGGIIRDMMLGATPPAVFQDELYLIVCVIGGLIVFKAAPPIAKRWNRVQVADAIGLGVFAGIGAAKGAAFGLGPLGVMLMAALTGTGGGVVRDLLVQKVPTVIKGGFYATAALLGGLTYWGLVTAQVSEGVALAVAAVVTTGLRIWAIKRNVNLPKAAPIPEA